MNSPSRMGTPRDPHSATRPNSNLRLWIAYTPNSLKPSLDGFFDTLRPMFVPLPKDPVGVGGSWEVVTHQEDGGAAIQQVVQYEVTGMTDRVVSCRVGVVGG